MASKKELVICIVNHGFTDLVMESARKAGARGGTVLTGRGTGNSWHEYQWPRDCFLGPGHRRGGINRERHQAGFPSRGER